ncbi:hypothetical protein AQUCO_00201015v1 [Aquilegia coerulea]|uniref:Uncharacterized protein n=1 Tax=Aquilegia coerulea TaxID=218851 RepID=A0A2G5F5U0_AQUCA|nr:hypothetical protein AQUCO_00201015v1 [Aquilegia coerulea]
MSKLLRQNSRCESQPLCNGFEWFSAAKKNKENQEKIDQEKITKNEGSVKLRIEGKLGMTAEGSGEDMAALIKQLQKM